jgi:cobalt/nickel transport system permease protein
MIAVTFILAIGFWALASVKLRTALTEKQIPLLSVITAVVFVAQMINFPILSGTSGHLVGGTLVAILFGPFAAIVSITAILVIQCFLFGDGGLTALGANTLNMGVVAVFAGYALYRVIARSSENGKRLLVASFIGAYAGVVVAALVCGLEIGFSTSFPYGPEVTVPAMLFWHLFIGIGEGIITAMVLLYLMRIRPDIVRPQPK